MEEYSLLLLKPDCAKRGLTETILKMVLSTGLEIVAVKTLILKVSDVEIFYKNCRKEDFFTGMSLFLQSGPVTVYVVKGENAINVLNKLVGFNEPAKADPGTIRRMGIDISHNLAHSSASRSDFFREASVVFSKDELKAMGAI